METVATMAIITIVATGLISVSNYTLNVLQKRDTTERMNDLRRGISGDPVIVLNEARSSFGYVGDMGNVPSQLSDLWTKGTQQTYVFDGAKKVGAGWNGPYMQIKNKEFGSALGLDGWGNPLTYNSYNPAVTDSSFGADVFAKLLSLGPNFTSGDNDDIGINFFKSEVVSRVQGYVKDDKNNGFPGVSVTLNYPSNGAPASASALTDNDGYYSFSNVPFGNRSVTIEPKLALASGTVVKSGSFAGGYADVTFTLKNYSSTDINVASLKLEYNVVPDAWFSEVKIGNTTTVWRYTTTGSSLNTTRFGNLDSVSFSAVPVLGSGTLAETVQIRVQSPITDVEDLVVGSIRRSGGSLQITFTGFNLSETGPGTSEDVSGVDFTVTLKDSANPPNIVGIVVVTP